MTKIIVCFLAAFLMLHSWTCAQDADRWLTGKYLNGYWVIEFMDSTEIQDEYLVGYYIGGIVDCAWTLNPTLMEQHYGKKTRNDIINSVVNYYRVAPRSMGRPIVDVLLTGCR